MERHTRTKAEKEYVNAIIQNLSLKRLTDQEIVDYLHNEKQIDIGRSTVTNIRNRIERQAAKWYLELKQSTSKYISNYKERLDSLLSYQKILNDIIARTKKEEIKIRAISELVSIEMNIFNLWKQLPNLDIVEQTKQNQEPEEPDQDKTPIIVDIEDINGVEDIPSDSWKEWEQCDGCKRWWSSKELLDYHKRKSTKSECAPQWA
jgi:hypothetical protein